MEFPLGSRGEEFAFEKMQCFFRLDEERDTISPEAQEYSQGTKVI